MFVSRLIVMVIVMVMMVFVNVMVFVSLNDQSFAVLIPCVLPLNPLRHLLHCQVVVFLSMPVATVIMWGHGIGHLSW